MATTAAQRRKKQQQQNQNTDPTVAIIVGIIVSVLGALSVLYGFCGAAVVWLGMVVMSRMWPPVPLTGDPDPATRQPTPAHDKEKADYEKFSLMRSASRKLILPGASWMPGIWPRMSWIAAVLTGLVCAFLPHGWGWVPLANFAGGFLVVSAFTSAKAEIGDGFTSAPQVTAGDVVKLIAHDVKQRIGLLLAGVLVPVAALLGLLGLLAFLKRFRLIRMAHRLANRVSLLNTPVLNHPVAVWNPWSWLICGALLAGTVVLTVTARKTVIAHWKLVSEARTERRDLWTPMKVSQPPPLLMDRQEAGPAVVDTFMIRSGRGTSEFFGKEAEIQNSMGSTATPVMVLPANEVDANGQPIEGKESVSQFRLVEWREPLPSIETVRDPTEAKLLIESVLCWIGQGFPEPMVNQLSRLSDSERSAWSFTLFQGPSLMDMDVTLSADIASFSSASACQVDTEWSNQVFVGNLADPELDLSRAVNPVNDIPAEDYFARLDENRWWSKAWESALGLAVNQPSWSPDNSEVGTVHDVRGTKATLHHEAYSIRLGQTLEVFTKQETKLNSALTRNGQAALFAYIDSWPTTGNIDGSRHPALISVGYSFERVPRIGMLRKPDPGEERACAWVVQGEMSHAFEMSKLPRPQLAAKPLCMTKKTSAGAIWQMKFRLYDGLTVAKVRESQEKLRSALGVQWLRVSTTGEPNVCIIAAGSDPDAVDFMSPKYSTAVARYEWDQTFMVSGLVSRLGELPKVTSSVKMESNPAITIIDGELPSGMSFESLKANRPKLQSSSGNEFVDVRRGEGGASTFRMLVSRTDPMPLMAEYDFDEPPRDGMIPLGAGTDGNTIYLNVEEVPHLLVAGSTGGGKTSFAQTMLTGAINAGMVAKAPTEVYVIDVQKQGADYTYALDYLKGYVFDPGTLGYLKAVALLEYVYEEMKRRQSLAVKHQVNKMKDLDDRPPTIWVFVDEFVGLISSAGKPSKEVQVDPEVEQARIEEWATFNAKTKIGYLMGRLIAEARAADIHMVTITQKMTQTALPNTMKDSKANMNSVLLTPGDSSLRMSTLKRPNDVPPIPPQTPPGRALYELVSGGCFLVQMWFAEMPEHRAFAQSHFPVLEKADFEDRIANLSDSADFVVNAESKDNRINEVGVLDLSEIDLSELDELDGVPMADDAGGLPVADDVDDSDMVELAEQMPFSEPGDVEFPASGASVAVGENDDALLPDDVEAQPVDAGDMPELPVEVDVPSQMPADLDDDDDDIEIEEVDLTSQSAPWLRDREGAAPVSPAGSSNVSVPDTASSPWEEILPPLDQVPVSFAPTPQQSWGPSVEKEPASAPGWVSEPERSASEPVSAWSPASASEPESAPVPSWKVEPERPAPEPEPTWLPEPEQTATSWPPEQPPSAPSDDDVLDDLGSGFTVVKPEELAGIMSEPDEEPEPDPEHVPEPGPQNEPEPEPEPERGPKRSAEPEGSGTFPPPPPKPATIPVLAKKKGSQDQDEPKPRRSSGYTSLLSSMTTRAHADVDDDFE